MEVGYCPACGAEVVESSMFCHKCGHRLSDDVAPRQFAADSAPAGERDNRQQFRPRGRDNGDLAENEIWEGGYSFKAMMPAIIGLTALGLLATIATAVLALPFFWIPIAAYMVALGGLALHYFYMRLKLKYRLTSQRFEHEVGVLRRVTDRIEVIDVDDVTVEQGLIDRFFGTGKIRVTSSDRTHPEIVLVGIDDVRRVAEQIDKARRKERVRRGLHIEAV